MNKAFEKILERLEKEIRILSENNIKQAIAINFAKEIVQEVAEEYNGSWIPCSERLPEEKLCEDGKYDPSEKVLIQLDNEEMFTSRYWSHRHSKDSDDFEKWIDLPDYYQDRVLAWQPLPEPYKEVKKDEK